MAGEFQATLASGMEAGRDPVEEKRQLLRLEQQQESKKQQAQQQFAHNFLKQFGIVKEKDIEPSASELEESLKSFGQKNGSEVKFNIAPDSSEEQKVAFLKQLHSAYKIPVPKGRSETVFDEKAAKGLEVSLSSSGEASLKSKENELSAEDAAEKLTRAMGIAPKGYKPTVSTKGGVGYKPESEDIGIYTLNPITGDVEQKASVPYGSKTYKAVMTPEQIKERSYSEAQGKAIGKNIETSDKLASAVKRLEIINSQFKKALPSGDKTPLEQRISGATSSWAAKAGLIDNKELVALQKNIRPMAINMIRAFGEVGNLSESEQKGAIDVVEQSGLTDDERIAATKQFIEFALAGASPEGIKHLRSRKDIQGILDAFGVELPNYGDEESVAPKGAAKVTDYKSIYGLK